jgi:hypothetical protein
MQAFESPEELESWIGTVTESQGSLGPVCFQSVVDGWYFLVFLDETGPHAIARHTGPFITPEERPAESGPVNLLGC